MLTLINLLIFWILYYFLHSFLVTDAVKIFFIEKVKFSQRGYRLFYVTFSVLSLIWLLYYTATLPHHYLWISAISKFLGLVLATYGIFITREAFRKYHTKAFLGLAEPALESKKLVKDGLQKYIRHPLYAGTILLLLGFFLYMPTLENAAVVSISIAYIFVGIYLEEKKLTRTFGDEYLRYKEKVPMLIPKWKQHK